MRTVTRYFVSAFSFHVRCELHRGQFTPLVRGQWMEGICGHTESGTLCLPCGLLQSTGLGLSPSWNTHTHTHTHRPCDKKEKKKQNTTATQAPDLRVRLLDWNEREQDKSSPHGFNKPKHVLKKILRWRSLTNLRTCTAKYKDMFPSTALVRENACFF